MLPVSYYTFGSIVDVDITPLEDILQASDVSKGLLLIISSPGGSGLAAERIINICRQYSDQNFECLVPKQAKSAATMICLGAKKIHMSATSELGPIDPQVPETTENGRAYLPADIVIDAYTSLLEEATKTKGRIEPYLQQLQRFDPRLIEQWKREEALSKDIAVKALKSGMLADMPESQIKKRMSIFLLAKKTAAHGRPIHADEARNKAKLNIVDVDIKSQIWRTVLEYHVRADTQLSGNAPTLIESPDHYFTRRA